TVYLGFSGYRQNDGDTYLFRSTDSGENWESISSNLPEMVVNDLLILPNSVDSQLFVALDGAVFYSDNAGTSWDVLGENLPFLTISELDVDYENEKLIAGTYSRSMWSYDISWAIDSLENPNIGIEEPEDSHFVAYPNPVINQLNINGKGLRHLSIYNTQGQLVFDHDAMPENPKHKFNLSHLNPGIYIYKTNLGEGKLLKE
ncbi:MAG: T9SS type A sorting domain-containing protein, partial [Flavobacteriales bacterium]